MPTARTLASHLDDITLVIGRSRILVAPPSADAAECRGSRGRRPAPLGRDADILNWLADRGRRPRM